MICEHCGMKSATSFYIMEFNGKTVEKYLCNDCKKLFEDYQKPKVFYEDKNSDERYCDICGTSLKDFIESGYTGCENCYKVFESDVILLINKTQKADYHTGKIPNKFATQQRFKNLNELLAKAIENNDLEQVNRISWEIKKFKGGEE